MTFTGACISRSFFAFLSFSSFPFNAFDSAGLIVCLAVNFLKRAPCQARSIGILGRDDELEEGQTKTHRSPRCWRAGGGARPAKANQVFPFA